MYWLILALTIASFTIQTASAQTITVNSTDPCFLNYTAGVQLWQNCGFDQDYLKFAIAPWEWITGGNFTMVLVSVIILGSYIKYQKMMYPILIGVLFIPISYFAFPESFISWSVIMAFAGIGMAVWYIFIHQTKEYSG